MVQLYFNALFCTDKLHSEEVPPWSIVAVTGIVSSHVVGKTQELMVLVFVD